MEQTGFTAQPGQGLTVNTPAGNMGGAKNGSATSQLLHDTVQLRNQAKERDDKEGVAKFTAAINALGFNIEDRGQRTYILSEKPAQS